MALFQPTNIFPDLKGGVKNGVVFNNVSNVDVSWTVNGNSTLYAYQIDFYKNDANSTYTGTTGKITLGTPFSAIDAEGVEQRFTATVALSKFTSSYDATSYEGKIKITQWWSSNAGDNVVQRSLSVFRMGGVGSLSVSAPVGWGGFYTFTGTVTLPVVYGGASLNWTRWQLFDGNGNEVQDTGKVWGATSYTWTPDWIAQGDGYYVTFSAETSLGRIITANSATFNVMHDAVVVNGGIKVSCDQAAQAVRIVFQDSLQTPGTFSGSYNIDYQNTVLAPGANAFWTIPASIVDAPWSFIWKGKIDTSNIIGSQPIFEIDQGDGTPIIFGFDDQAQEFYTQPAFSDIGNIQVQNGDEYMVVFTMGATAGTKNVFSWYVLHLSGGTILGSASGTVSGYTQARAARVFIYQGTTEYWQLLYGTYNADIITSGTTGADCLYKGPSISFDGIAGTDSAVIWALGSDINDVMIYRQDANGALAPVSYLYLPTLPFGYYTADYTALNGQTYQYVVYYQESEDDQPTIIKSAPVTPCFWSWALIEATEGAAENTYDVVNVFLFRNNVSSGSIANGNSRNVYNTFTRYPVVMKNTQNRKAGTLGGLIGSVSGGVYTDTNATMDALYALSQSNNALFLRNRRGDFLRVALTGEISMTTEDTSPKQQLTASVPWVEIGPVKNISVVQGVS